MVGGKARSHIAESGVEAEREFASASHSLLHGRALGADEAWGFRRSGAETYAAGCVCFVMMVVINLYVQSVQ